MSPVYFSPSLNPAENRLVGDFVSQLVWGKPDQLSEYCTMGVFDKGKLVAGTVYHNWYPDQGVIELTSASTTKRWLSKPVIKAMFELPFDVLGAQLAALRVSERNTAMIRIAKAFGFSEVFIPRLRGRDEGEFIFTYTDDQWRSSRFN